MSRVPCSDEFFIKTSDIKKNKTKQKKRKEKEQTNKQTKKGLFPFIN